MFISSHVFLQMLWLFKCRVGIGESEPIDGLCYWVKSDINIAMRNISTKGSKGAISNVQHFLEEIPNGQVQFFSFPNIV